MLIGKKWKVESDSLNVILSERITKRPKGKAPYEGWGVRGYFSTVANALKFLIEHEVKGTGLTDLETVVNKIDELKGLIEQVGENKGNVSCDA